MQSIHDQEVKVRYHVAKLALFNVRFIHRLQNDPNTQSIIEDEAKKNGMENPPSLLNQSTFLQFSYICLVWLWEAAKNAKLGDDLLKEFSKSANLRSLTLPDKAQIKGEREIKTWKDVIRLLRNALAHGNIKTYEDSFRFSDINRHNNAEKDFTTLTLSWKDLAIISETVIHCLTPLIYPSSQHSGRKD